MFNNKYIYSFALLILLPFLLIYIIFISIKKDDFNFIKNRLGILNKINNTNNICIHCTSLGEVNGAKELIKEIIKNNNVLISTNTNSGKIRACELFPDLDVVYFPLDYKFIVSNWLKSLKIKSMIVYETEIWPNFYKICGYENIKLCIVNARIQKNLHKKKFVKKIYAEALENCQFILCKSNYEKKKYLELGINEKNIFSIGNLKYAYKPQVIKEEDQKRKSTEFSNTKNFFLMASTHDPDEKNFLQAIQELLINEISVVIAPRHIERSKKIANMFRDIGISVHFLSNASKNYVLGEWSINAVLIIDTFGDLSKFYSNARYVYVGGGYSRRGVQNIIEPSIYGKPILVGPNIDNFYEEIMNLKAQDGITIIEDVASVSTKESVAKHIREFRNLNDETLIKRGDVAKEHSLKFKNIVEKYVEFLKQKKVIS